MEWVPPLQEEQSGTGSANYDVELIHLSEAHRDVLRGGTCRGARNCCEHEIMHFSSIDMTLIMSSSSYTA